MKKSIIPLCMTTVLLLALSGCKDQDAAETGCSEPKQSYIVGEPITIIKDTPVEDCSTTVDPVVTSNYDTGKPVIDDIPGENSSAAGTPAKEQKDATAEPVIDDTPEVSSGTTSTPAKEQKDATDEPVFEGNIEICSEAPDELTNNKYNVGEPRYE